MKPIEYLMKVNSRNTGTVHTFAKAGLTSVAMGSVIRITTKH